jgi:hypothetical protein
MIVSSFIIQANVIMIINYNRHLFIVQATAKLWTNQKLSLVTFLKGTLRSQQKRSDFSIKMRFLS